MKQFNEGDVVYFISSSVFIKKATVIRNAGGFCTIRFSDGNCGTSGTRVRESKLYRTEEEAKKVVEQHQNANGAVKLDEVIQKTVPKYHEVRKPQETQ